jgi:hypothetical protein
MRHTAFVLSVAAASVAAAQAPKIVSSPFSVAPYAGYMVAGNLLNGPLGTSVSSAPGFMYGTQAAYVVAPQLSLVANLGYSSSTLHIGVPFLGGIDVGRSTMLVYDADVQLDLPKTQAAALPFSPFVQVGAGAIRYELSESSLSRRSTNGAANIGVGADFAVGRGLALRAMAKDYIGKFDFNEAVGVDYDGGTSHNWGLSVGMRIDF